MSQTQIGEFHFKPSTLNFFVGAGVALRFTLSPYNSPGQYTNASKMPKDIWITYIIQVCQIIGILTLIFKIFKVLFFQDLTRSLGHFGVPLIVI